MPTPFATPGARALGFGLRGARERRGIRAGELARMAGVKQQDLSHWERGSRVPKIEQVALLLGCLRVDAEERNQLFELARTAHEPNWLERTFPGVSPAMATYIEYERTATAEFHWEPFLIPALLQTSDYTRAILDYHELPKREVERLIMIRQRCREVLTGPTPLEYSVVLGETALRENIGGPEAMVAQLRHLLAASQAKNVSVRVIPDKAGFHPGLKGHFVIFDFADLPSIVHIEHIRGVTHIYDEDHLVDYRAAIDIMLPLALSEQQTQELIQRVIAEKET
jgi:transcriptional regulator with XRE-family HTH domain